MVSDKKRKISLKGPDDFQRYAYQALDWALKNQKLILAVVLPVVAVGLGSVGYRKYKLKIRQDVKEAVATVDQAYNEQLQSIETKEKVLRDDLAKINDQLKQGSLAGSVKPKDSKGVNSSDQVSAQTETNAGKASLEEKKRAIEAELAGLKPEKNEAIEGYLKVFEQHHDHPEGRFAALKAVQLLLNDPKKEDFQRVNEILSRLFEQAFSVPSQKGNIVFYETKVALLWASVLVEIKDYDKAIEVYDTVMKSVSDEQLAAVLFEKGRVELLAGKKDKAVKTFEKIIDEHNASHVASQAMEYKAYTELIGLPTPPSEGTQKGDHSGPPGNNASP